jgi:1-acyl-sn-glycerol-3-phosphate acyltransferase
MKPPPLLVRRGLVDPLWVPVAVALAAVATAAAIVGLVAAPVDRRLRGPRLALMAAAYCLVSALVVTGCAWLWLTRPLVSRRADSSKQAHARLLMFALGRLLAAAGPLLSFRLLLEAAPVPATLTGRPLLVLARHGGPGDSAAIAWLLLTVYRRLPVIVLKDVLRWEPAIDLVLGRLGAVFLPAGSPASDLTTLLAASARTLTDAEAMLIFPEGGNWTPGRYRRALARLRARGDYAAAAKAAASPHVLPPRPAGTLACLEARCDLDVLVIAHTGLDDLVSAQLAWAALPLRGRPLVMRGWHYRACDLPREAAQQLRWLEIQWAVVDAWIDARKTEETGSRPRADASPDGSVHAGAVSSQTAGE